MSERLCNLLGDRVDTADLQQRLREIGRMADADVA
jgi:hypothetical protein